MSELLAEARGLDDPASRAGSPWPPPAVMRPRSYSCKERDNGAIIPCPDEPGRLLSNRLKPRAEARRGDTQMNTRLFFLLALPLPGGPGGHAPLRATAARGHKPDGKLCLAGYLPQATASCHVARGDALPPRYCHTHEARAKVSTSSTPRPETLSGPETVTVARTPSGRNRKTAGPSAPHSTRPPPTPARTSAVLLDYYHLCRECLLNRSSKRFPNGYFGDHRSEPAGDRPAESPLTPGPACACFEPAPVSSPAGSPVTGSS